MTKKEADEVCKLIDESMQRFHVTPSARIMMITSSKASTVKEHVQKMAMRRKP